MINPFKKTYTPKELNIFRFLIKIKLFEQLTYDEMSLFIPYLHEREYNHQEVVFLRNDPSQALYLVRKGRISLSIEVNGALERLTSVREGFVLGESSLLKHTKRHINAIVDSSSASFYVIPQLNIFQIFESELKVKAKMLESLAAMRHEHDARLFKAYKSSLGFFELSHVYAENR